jgi:hypothetical protein
MTKSIKLFFSIFYVINFLFSMKLFASQIPIPPPLDLPNGDYLYQGHIHALLLKKTKLFEHNKAEEAKTIEELKSKGYLCLRRSMTQTLCQFKTENFQLPANTAEKTYKAMSGYPIHFPKNPDVTMSHNGSTTQEWLVSGPFLIGETELNLYRITRTNEGEIFIAFPVSDENPISYLTYHETRGLGFRLTLQGTDSEGWKLNYIFEAIYEPAP